jgi:hypothetical protein
MKQAERSKRITGLISSAYSASIRIDYFFFLAVVRLAVVFLAVPVFALVDFFAVLRVVFFFLAVPVLALVDFLAVVRLVAFLAVPLLAFVDLAAVLRVVFPLAAVFVAIVLTPLKRVVGTIDWLIASIGHPTVRSNLIQISLLKIALPVVS